MNKICTKCGIQKTIEAFSLCRRNVDGHLHMCRVCRSTYNKFLHNRNPQLRKNSHKRYYESHVDDIKIKNQSNAIKYKQRQSNYDRLRYQLIKDEITKKKRIRRHIDPEFKIAHNLRVRLYNVLKKTHKSCSAVRNLGCTLGEFRQYLESKFKEGMTWQNHSQFGWHIDHIRPISSFDLTNKEQFKAAIHYSNLQPLWAKENLSKGAR